MTTRSEAIADNIAARITRNKTRCRFSTLHRLAVEETNFMSTPTSSTLNGDSKGQPRTPIGRPLADNPATLAAASPAKLTADTGSPAVICGTQNTQVRPVVVKQVDHMALEGSNKGDHRTPAVPVNMDAFTNPPSPRQQMRGQRDQRGYNETGKAFQSTNNASDSDAGN
jgi:hypothetical protein